MTSKLKHYCLIRDGIRWTNKSTNYRGGRYGTSIAVVIAYSIRQALFVANNDKWFAGDTGIVYMTGFNPDDREKQWFNFNDEWIDDRNLLFDHWTTAKVVPAWKREQLKTQLAEH